MQKASVGSVERLVMTAGIDGAEVSSNGPPPARAIVADNGTYQGSAKAAESSFQVRRRPSAAGRSTLRDQSRLIRRTTPIVDTFRVPDNTVGIGVIRASDSQLWPTSDEGIAHSFRLLDSKPSLP